MISTECPSCKRWSSSTTHYPTRYSCQCDKSENRFPFFLLGFCVFIFGITGLMMLAIL